MYSIPTDNILHEIYALSALRAVMSVNRESTRQAPVLDRDRRQALMSLVTTTATHLADKLRAASATVSTDGAMITIDLGHPPGREPLSFSRAFAQMVAYQTLATANIGYDNDSSERYQTLGADILADLASTLRSESTTGHRITPAY